MIAFPLAILFVFYMFMKRSYLINDQLEDATAEISRELEEQSERLRELNTSMGNPPPQPPPTRTVPAGWTPPPQLPQRPDLRVGSYGRARPVHPTPEEMARFKAATGRDIKKVKPKDLYGEMMKDE